MPMTSSQSTYHITYKSNTFYLFNDALHIEKNARLGIINHIHNLF